MQPPTAGSRSDLTTAQVVALLQDAPSVAISAGLELLDMGLNVVEDISDDLQEGRVSRQAYANLHGQASLQIARELDWGNAVVRPYLTMTANSVSARFNLGAYFCSTPKQPAGWDVAVHDVDGYDILQALDSPVGDAYAVDVGSPYLSTVEGILTSLGYSKYRIDQSSADVVLPTARVWPLDTQTSWLNVVNDLIAAIGYQGIWSDWDGALVVQPYENPQDRSSEWLYDTGILTSMMYPTRSRTRDYFAAPNRWVAIRSNLIEGSTPIEGDGIYTYINQSDGDTSVEARGRVITRVMQFEAANQASLVSQALISIGADMRLKTTLEVATWPNPLHWHFDRLTVDDPDLGGLMETLGSQWELPLNGDPMNHVWNVI